MLKEFEYNGKYGEVSSSDPSEVIVPAMFMLFNPLINTVTYALSKERSKGQASLLEVYGYHFVFLFSETVLQFLFSKLILPLFFTADTSTFMRFALRFISQLFLL